jgi:hypothetical protein
VTVGILYLLERKKSFRPRLIRRSGRYTRKMWKHKKERRKTKEKLIASKSLRYTTKGEMRQKRS